ncbi:MAG: hypothetical protein HYY24_29695 [Verrucomicrobia bacterium]|nr:hypothetical protein [Verrucomicrobiota bacterium]
MRALLLHTPARHILACAVLLVLSGSRLDAQPKPLPNAHSHNDYERPRPLLDALEHGFCSVEADIYLVEDQLLVAHDRRDVKPERTLQALYLDPLQQRVKQNGGRVYRGGPPVTLLIDIKSEAEGTYRRLADVLLIYTNMLTRFRADGTDTNAVTAIISGNRPRELMASQAVRYAAFDGRLADLEGGASPHFIPLVSESWASQFRWRGVGPLPDEEREKVQQLVKKAHQQGRRVRFWAAPDHAAGWKTLREAGVDLINTDKPAELEKFLLEAQSR